MRGGPAGDGRPSRRATCRASAGAASPTGRCRRSAGWPWSRWRRGWRSGRRAHASAEEQTAADFAGAWERGDYAAMYGAARRRVAPGPFAAASSGAPTATPRPPPPPPRSRRATRAASRTARSTVPIDVRTRVFGTVAADLVLPGERGRRDLGAAARLPRAAPRRGAEPPQRAARARRAAVARPQGAGRGTGAARAARRSEAIAGSIAGTLEPEETREERARAVRARLPASTGRSGQNGLERAFEDRLAGRPGGELLAGRAGARPRPAAPARPVRTTIDTRLQEAAVTGAGGALRRRRRARPPQRGDPGAGRARLLGPAAAGLDVQDRDRHRGARGGLGEARAPSSRSRRAAMIDGVELENANGEFCGGTFRDSFAHSCNSVFAPLGVKVGAEALVDAAERFGWNAEPHRARRGAQHAPAGDRDPVAARGRLHRDRPVPHAGHAARCSPRWPRRSPRAGCAPVPTLALGERTRARARDLAAGGAHGRLDDGRRGGLRHRHRGGAARCEGGGQDRHGGARGHARPGDGRDRTPDPSNTDAWFTAYAPAPAPRIAVAVMLVRAGAGGATAAPAARVVLEAAL